jgi:hypothetical protein
MYICFAAPSRYNLWGNTGLRQRNTVIDSGEISFACRGSRKRVKPRRIVPLPPLCGRETKALPMNDLDLNDVRTFVAIAQAGTLTAAAKEMLFPPPP